MEQQVDNVAGLDVHRDNVVACARLGRGERPRVLKQSFKTTTAGVGELARWLADLEVTRVVMESTGVYWKPLYYGLEGLFAELWLVNAHHVKNVPGRKSAWNGRLLRAAECVVIERSHIQLERGADHAQIATPQRGCPRRLRFQQEHVGGGSPSSRRGDPDDRAGHQRRGLGAPLCARFPRTGLAADLL